MPDISIIVPVYNVEQYIHRCVDSILAQTFADFELILIDDGSPDNCGMICDEYAKKDIRVKVVHQKNKGVSVARNIGTKLAEGDFITYIDSDDWIERNFLECMYGTVKKYHSDICVVSTYDEDVALKENKIEELDFRQAIIHFMKLNNYKIKAPWGKLVRREIAYKYPFPEKRSYSEDLATVYKWYYCASKTVDTNFDVYHYSINETSICGREWDLFRLDELNTYDEILYFLKNELFHDLYKEWTNKYIYLIEESYKQLKKLKKYPREKRQIRRKLKAELKVNNIKILQRPQSYELLFPHFMWFYWIFKSGVNKLKRGN